MYDFLNDNEKEELALITVDTTKKIIAMADKNNIDRDSAMKFFSDLFAMMVSMSTFEEYEMDKEDAVQL